MFRMILNFFTKLLFFAYKIAITRLNIILNKEMAIRQKGIKIVENVLLV